MRRAVKRRVDALREARAKADRPNSPVPSGCCPMRRLRRRAPRIVGSATTFVARLASIRIGPCSATARDLFRGSLRLANNIRDQCVPCGPGFRLTTRDPEQQLAQALRRHVGSYATSTPVGKAEFHGLAVCQCTASEMIEKRAVADHSDDTLAARCEEGPEFRDPGLDHLNGLDANPSRVGHAIDMPPHIREMRESQQGKVDRELRRPPANVATVLDALAGQRGHQYRRCCRMVGKQSGGGLQRSRQG